MNLKSDDIIIGLFRRMLRDMYDEQRYQETEQNFYNRQPFKNQVTLNYIKSYFVESYAKDFKFYHLFYSVYCFCVIPQYIVFIIISLLTTSFVPAIVSLVIKFMLTSILKKFKFPHGMHDFSIYNNIYTEN